ncbi:MAG: YdbL family protein [Gammaproteobacteria bacterium]|nr:YdbL family protein [Gammaproteobacteria bacterium]NNM01647.1 YdbL family protein [Gammaproteobacteria bacterium]
MIATRVEPRHSLLLAAVCLALCACVTVNVYFPAAAAERAADRLIRDIYGEDAGDGAAPAGDEPEARRIDAVFPARLFAATLDYLIAPAAAQQPDIDVSTPAIQKLKSAMASRHRSLAPYYGSGAIGMTGQGTLDLRDAAKVPLKERNQVKRLVNDENADRARLYAEIASANGHPEWERDIRSIFSSRWVGNAPSGWWYQSGSGAWTQK